MQIGGPRMNAFAGKRRERRAQASGDIRTAIAPSEPASGSPEAAMAASGDIPDHVWNMLQEAGEEAARRLRDMLQGPAFASFKPTERTRLIELALTRAYGLPVRRSVEVKLSSDDADAVAASLLSLGESLPERRTMRDITPDKD